MILKKFFILMMSALLILTSCNVTFKNSSSSDSSSSSNPTTTGTFTDVTTFNDENATNDDPSLTDWSTNVVKIVYSDSTATVSIPSAYSGKITCSSGTSSNVIIKATTDDKVVYNLSGTSTDGSFKLYSEKKYKIQLDNLTVTSKTRAVINIQSSKRGFIEVVDGTKNVLTDPKTYTTTKDEDMKGCIFSEGELILIGSGSLTVTGNYKHAICSDDYIRVAGPVINVTDASSDAVHTKDCFLMTSGTLNVTKSSGNIIECSGGFIAITGGTISGSSDGDGIKASFDESSDTVNPYIYVKDAKITVNTSGVKSHGFLTKSSIVILGSSNITVNVTGDGSKCLKSGGLIQFGSSDSSDCPTLNLSSTGETIIADGDSDYTIACCVSSGTDILCYNAKITGKSTAKKGRGFAADGNILLANGTYNFTLTGSALSNSTSSRGPGGFGGGGRPTGPDLFGGESSSSSGKPKGMKATGTITIKGGTVTVTNTSGKGIACQGAMTVSGGKISVTVGHEGLESKSTLTVSGGEIYSEAADDAINSGSTFTISDGFVYARAQGDGLDSNGAIIISGGVVVVSQTGSGNSPIDCGDNSSFTVTGTTATIFAMGSSDMFSETIPSSTSLPMIYSTSLGSVLLSLGVDGIIALQSPQTYAAALLVSSSLTNGSPYSFVKGGTLTGSLYNSNDAGVYLPANVSGGTSVSATATTQGGGSSGFGGGGMGGFPR